MLEIAGGVYVKDVVGAVPRKNPWRRRHDPIERIYLHHSGAFGLRGLRGLYRSAEYSVDHLKWPSTGYHYWIPFQDAAEEIRIYQANPDDVHSWHTGGACNAHGLSVTLQGDLRSKRPSDYQIEALEALVPWLREKHDLDTDRWLSFHRESSEWGGSGKKTCPGPFVEAWVKSYRERV